MNNGTQRVKARRASALDRRLSDLDDLRNDRSAALTEYMAHHSLQSNADVRARKIATAESDIANLEAKLGYR